MARPKKVEDSATADVMEYVAALSQRSSGIAPLSIDYPNEGLNDMARKINEIINHLNAS